MVPAKVTPARDQQSLCHWLILSPPYSALLGRYNITLLSFIKVAMGTMAFYVRPELFQRVHTQAVYQVVHQDGKIHGGYEVKTLSLIHI